MRRYAQLAMPFAAAVAYVLLLLTVFRQSYWENDNIGILDDLRHGHTVSFMSVLLGRVLTFFYHEVSGSVPWYGLTLYTTLTAALGLAAVSIRTLCRHGWLTGAVLTSLAIQAARFVITASYNAASIATGFACVLALMVYLRRETRPRWWVVLGLGFLFTFTYLIRTGGLKAVALFAGPLLVYEAVTRLRGSYRHLVLFVLPLVAVMAVDATLNRSTVDDEFRQFRAWNQVRGMVHGFPVLELNADNEAVRQANGWEQTHYSLLQSWAFFDEGLFNVTTLGNLRVHSVPLPGQDGLPVVDMALNGRDLLGDYCVHWLVLGAMLHLTALRNRRLFLLQAAQVLLVLGGAVLMATYLRFPGRIAYVLLFGALLFSFYILFRDGTEETPVIRTLPRHSVVKFTVFVLLVSLADVPMVVERIRDAHRRQEQYYLNDAALRELDPGFLVMATGKAPGHECRDPLKVHDDCLPAVPAGWRIFSPRFYAFLAEYDLQWAWEVVPYLVNRDDAYVVSSEHFAKLLARYLQHSHQRRVRVEFVQHLSDGVNVYTLEPGRNRRTKRDLHTAPKNKPRLQVRRPGTTSPPP